MCYFLYQIIKTYETTRKYNYKMELTTQENCKITQNKTAFYFIYIYCRYRGIVEPYLSYCCSVWGRCSESKIDVLQKIQNRAVRIVTSGPYDASAALITESLGWSTISDLIRKETATLAYKSLNSLAPNYLRKLFAKCSDERERFLRSSETDTVPKNDQGPKSFFLSRCKAVEQPRKSY